MFVQRHLHSHGWGNPKGIGHDHGRGCARQSSPEPRAQPDGEHLHGYPFNFKPQLRESGGGEHDFATGEGHKYWVGCIDLFEHYRQRRFFRDQQLHRPASAFDELRDQRQLYAVDGRHDYRRPHPYRQRVREPANRFADGNRLPAECRLHGYTGAAQRHGHCGAVRRVPIDGCSAGGFSQSVSFSCNGLPRGATCSVSPNPTSLQSGSQAMVTVTVNTAVRAGVPHHP